MTTALVAPTASTDLLECYAHLKAGSKSFSVASLLLPPETRPATAALYAFCRVADDAVDEGGGAAGLAEIRQRLDGIYANTPIDDPVDRAFTSVVQGYAIPRPVLELLLEGFAWDVGERAYETIDDTVAYGVRVASTVGVMMTLIMGRTDRATLARAADLGVAMQLTNIARDVGEDARNGRVYLPAAWLREAGVDRATLGAEPVFTPALGQVVARLLAEADGYYARARTGIGRLPWRCRFAIRAASLIYRDIGRVIRARGYDSVSGRAWTSASRKVWLLARSAGAGVWTPRLDLSPPPAPVAPLIDAAAPPCA